MLIASGHYLASRQAWIQSQPSSHFVSVNQTSKLLVWQSARSPATEHWRSCDYSLRSLAFLMPLRFSVTAPAPTTHKARDQVRASVCVHVHVGSQPTCAFKTQTPLICRSTSEVMLITKPNTINKLSFSAVSVSACVMTVEGVGAKGPRCTLSAVCKCVCVRTRIGSW